MSTAADLGTITVYSIIDAISQCESPLRFSFSNVEMSISVYFGPWSAIRATAIRELEDERPISIILYCFESSEAEIVWQII